MSDDDDDLDHLDDKDLDEKDLDNIINKKRRTVFCASCRIKFAVEDAEFMCHSENHGFLWTTFKNKDKQTIEIDDKKLDKHFNTINKPWINKNLLIFGQTGVGKSTFINGLHLYESFDSLEGALKGEYEPLISINVTKGDQQFILGSGKEEHETNERFTIGESSTQAPQSYLYYSVQRHERIILVDTPGMGDSRGVDQDNKNMEEIMSYLSRFKHIHAVMFILFPDLSRIDTPLQYILLELTRQFHSSIIDNFIFCFKEPTFLACSTKITCIYTGIQLDTRADYELASMLNFHLNLTIKIWKK